MVKLRFSEQAQDDLLEIGDGIAEHDPERAMQVLNDLEEQCQALAALPMMGRERGGLAPTSSLRHFLLPTRRRC